MIFRARDVHALQTLEFYHSLVLDDHHDRAVQEKVAEFAAFKRGHPDRMKEPSITHHVRLKDDNR